MLLLWLRRSSYTNAVNKGAETSFATDKVDEHFQLLDKPVR